MRLFVLLRKDEFEQLLTMARSERRRPQDQAAFLIASALRGTSKGNPEVAEVTQYKEPAGAGCR